MNKEIIEKIENQDVLGIASSAASPFISVLSKDEINTCILNAVWKALKKYDSRVGCKFTTYLYKGVALECLNQQKNNSSKTSYILHKNLPDPIDHTLRIDMLDLIKHCDEPEWIYDRYYKNMTIKELAQQRGICGEAIRMKIKKTLKKLKEHLF